MEVGRPLFLPLQIGLELSSNVEVSPELKDKAQNHETITWPRRVDAASERLKRCLMPHVVDSPVCTELDTNGFVVKGEGATPTDPQREKEPEVVYPGGAEGSAGFTRYQVPQGEQRAASIW